MRPLLLLALMATQVHASENFYRLFNQSSEGIDPEVKKAVEKMEKQCNFFDVGREGPTAREVARCEKASKPALTFGAAAARYALVRLDREGLMEEGSIAREHLYDLIGRSGDLAMVEPLIYGLEQEKKREDLSMAAGVENWRHWEVEMITNALTQLTFAELHGEASGASRGASREPVASGMPAYNAPPAIQWRQFWTASAGKTREQLLTIRTAESRTELASTDVKTAVHGADFLMQQPATNAEGVAALKTIGAREDLTANWKRRIQRMIKSQPAVATQLAKAPGA